MFYYFSKKNSPAKFTKFHLFWPKQPKPAQEPFRVDHGGSPRRSRLLLWRRCNTRWNPIRCIHKASQTWNTRILVVFPEVRRKSFQNWKKLTWQTLHVKGNKSDELRGLSKWNLPRVYINVYTAGKTSRNDKFRQWNASQCLRFQIAAQPAQSSSWPWIHFSTRMFHSCTEFQWFACFPCRDNFTHWRCGLVVSSTSANLMRKTVREHPSTHKRGETPLSLFSAQAQHTFCFKNKRKNTQCFSHSPFLGLLVAAVTLRSVPVSVLLSLSVFDPLRSWTQLDDGRRYQQDGSDRPNRRRHHCSALTLSRTHEITGFFVCFSPGWLSQVNQWNDHPSAGYMWGNLWCWWYKCVCLLLFIQLFN